MNFNKFINYLYFSKLSFSIQFLEDIYLPKFKGSTLRGGFGYIFRKISCITKKDDCQTCIVAKNCPYSNIFTNPASIRNRTFLSENTFTPHPFVFDFEDKKETGKNFYKKGDLLDFNLVIVGDANKYIPYFIYTFIELGKHGIGKNFGKFELSSVKNNVKNNKELIYSINDEKINGENVITLTPSEVIKQKIKTTPFLKEFQNFYKNYFNPQDRVVANSDNSIAINNNINNSSPSSNDFDSKYNLSIRFLSPTRIKHKLKYTDSIDFEIFFTNVFRRLYFLISLFCDENHDLKDVNLDAKNYLANAKKIKTSKESIVWHDWERYSSRQKTTMKLGGLIGDIVFEGEKNLFLPYLVPIFLCEELHVGKGTSFGLGKYSLIDFAKIN